ncbi:hypothetical protein KI387_015418, partial [Taxus chinensis]
FSPWSDATVPDRIGDPIDNTLNCRNKCNCGKTNHELMGIKYTERQILNKIIYCFIDMGG